MNQSITLSHFTAEYMCREGEYACEGSVGGVFVSGRGHVYGCVWL